VEKLKLDGWVEKHINRPYLAFDSVLCEALQHNLPQIALPPHHEGMRYPIPSVIFRMFDYTDCPDVSRDVNEYIYLCVLGYFTICTKLGLHEIFSQGQPAPVLPGSHSIERFLIEEELRDILKKYHQERREWYHDKIV